LAPGIFKILIFNLIPVFYGTAWGMWMVAENKQRYLIFFQFLSMGIALFLNLKLIPIYGVQGAAYSLIITQFVGIFSALTFYKPALSWMLFIKSLNPKNLFDIFKYLKN